MTNSDSFDAEAVLDEGRKAYAEKRHKKALESFTRVMKRCPCARGLKRERCRCKNFEAAAEKKQSIFHEAMYTCSCTVGKLFSKCDEMKHVRALDSRAATFEAMGEIERAKLDAEWLLELAPRLPEGYLRLGKVARLQKKHEFAWNVYNAGIEATESGPRSPLVEKLHLARKPLNQRFSRRDPISLPAEILQIILSSIDFVTLVRCAQVSKTWRTYLTTGMNQSLWKTLHFDKTCRKVSIQALKYLLKNANYRTQGLIVDDCRKAGITREKFKAVMLAVYKLEHLELRQPYEAMPLPDGVALPRGRGIRHLVLEGFNRDTDPLSKTIQSCLKACQLLQHLELVNCHEPFWHGRGLYDGPTFPHMKYLRISPDALQMLHYGHLYEFAPNLEQLWLDAGFVQFDGYAETNDKVWPHLKVLVFNHRKMRDTPTFPPQLVISRMLSQECWSDLQHLELDMLPRSDLMHHFQLSNLRTVRLKNLTLDGDQADSYFGPSLRNEKLRTFTIQFPNFQLGQRWGEASYSHLPTYNWLAGSPSIRCLILRGFTFGRWEDPVTGELPKFLSSFPNLEEIVVQGTMYEDAELCTVIEGFMKACQALKTIWQDQIKGVMMDKLVDLGRKHDVQVKTGEPATEWPVALDNGD